jgi:hypothetical protein
LGQNGQIWDPEHILPQLDLLFRHGEGFAGALATEKIVPQSSEKD